MVAKKKRMNSLQLSIKGRLFTSVEAGGLCTAHVFFAQNAKAAFEVSSE